MKNNKKGFTLVELLAVIVILAIILGIAAYNGLEAIKLAKKREVESFAKQLVELGPDFYLKNKSEIPKILNKINTDLDLDEEYQVKKISITSDILKEKGYLKSEIKLGNEKCVPAILCIDMSNSDEIKFSSSIKCGSNKDGIGTCGGNEFFQIDGYKDFFN